MGTHLQSRSRPGQLTTPFPGIFRKAGEAHPLVSKSLVWCFALGMLGTGLSAATAGENSRPLAREIFSVLVGLPSSQSRGGSEQAAKYAAKLLIEAGFPERDGRVLGPSPSAAGVLA